MISQPMQADFIYTLSRKQRKKNDCLAHSFKLQFYSMVKKLTNQDVYISVLIQWLLYDF